MAIRNPLEWISVRRRPAMAGVAAADDYWPQAEARDRAPAVRRIGLADLREALAAGARDFGAHRTDVVFLCAIYPVIGLLLARLASGGGLLQFLFPLVAGFALVGPVVGIGLMEMSRRRELGTDPDWRSAFAVLRSPSIGGILVLAAALVAIFCSWMFTAAAIYAATLGPQPPASVAGFARDLFTTDAGWMLIGVGMGVGFLFALLVLAIGVASFPLMLDGPAGVEAAVRFSVRAVAANPVPMAAWGLIVAAALVVGSLPFFLGLVVVLPVLGHATWHLYRRLAAR